MVKLTITSCVNVSRFCYGKKVFGSMYKDLPLAIMIILYYYIIFYTILYSDFERYDFAISYTTFKGF